MSTQGTHSAPVDDAASAGHSQEPLTFTRSQSNHHHPHPPASVGMSRGYSASAVPLRPSHGGFDVTPRDSRFSTFTSSPDAASGQFPPGFGYNSSTYRHREDPFEQLKQCIDQLSRTMETQFHMLYSEVHRIANMQLPLPPPQPVAATPSNTHTIPTPYAGWNEPHHPSVRPEQYPPDINWSKSDTKQDHPNFTLILRHRDGSLVNTDENKYVQNIVAAISGEVQSLQEEFQIPTEELVINTFNTKYPDHCTRWKSMLESGPILSEIVGLCFGHWKAEELIYKLLYNLRRKQSPPNGSTNGSTKRKAMSQAPEQLDFEETEVVDKNSHNGSIPPIAGTEPGVPLVVKLIKSANSTVSKGKKRMTETDRLSNIAVDSFEMLEQCLAPLTSPAELQTLLPPIQEYIKQHINDGLIREQPIQVTPFNRVWQNLAKQAEPETRNFTDLDQIGQTYPHGITTRHTGWQGSNWSKGDYNGLFSSVVGLSKLADAGKKHLDIVRAIQCDESDLGLDLTTLQGVKALTIGNAEFPSMVGRLALDMLEVLTKTLSSSIPATSDLMTAKTTSQSNTAPAPTSSATDSNANVEDSGDIIGANGTSASQLKFTDDEKQALQAIYTNPETAGRKNGPKYLQLPMLKILAAKIGISNNANKATLVQKINDIVKGNPLEYGISVEAVSDKV